MYCKRLSKSLIVACAALVLAADSTPPVLAQAKSKEGTAAAKLNYQKGKAAEDKKDYAAALLLYRKAADGGDPRAMNCLGTMYGRGLGGVAKDDGVALIAHLHGSRTTWTKIPYKHRHRRVR